MEKKNNLSIFFNDTISLVPSHQICFIHSVMVLHMSKCTIWGPNASSRNAISSCLIFLKWTSCEARSVLWNRICSECLSVFLLALSWRGLCIQTPLKTISDKVFWIICHAHLSYFLMTVEITSSFLVDLTLLSPLPF